MPIRIAPGTLRMYRASISSRLKPKITTGQPARCPAAPRVTGGPSEGPWPTKPA